MDRFFRPFRLGNRALGGGLALVLLASLFILTIGPAGAEPASQAGASWTGEYYSNPDLIGPATRVRSDTVIAFFWGRGAPTVELPADGFSVRWTGSFDLDGGIYRFVATSDDGVRVWLDGALIIDEWHDAPGVTYEVTRNLHAGMHSLRVEYYENTGEARIHFHWERVLVPVQPAWRGRYYANPDLAGPPALERSDAAIDFNWGYAAPAAGLPTDGFSARWTGSFTFDAGTYRFVATSDDGVRVWLDGVLIIDEWHDGAGLTYQVQRTVTGGTHELQVEYYENAGGAQIEFSWQLVTSPVYPDWRGSYYDNADLAGPAALVRNDVAIDFNWGYGSPVTGLPTDGFSVRWTGSFDLDGGTYRFVATSDDGVRVWLDGVLIIDEWHDAPGVTYEVERAVAGGVHELQVEYYENAGGAQIEFYWQRLGLPPTPSAWRGAYYGNVSLDGAPALVRRDEAVDFDWGAGSPAEAIPADSFSVRWTRQAYFDGHTYRFHARADGGVTIWVGDQIVLDRWHDGGVFEFSALSPVDPGQYQVKVEYMEGVGDALVQVWWERSYISYQPDPEYTDWRGAYWSNQDREGRPALVRNDEAIDFDWGTGFPAEGLPADQFSVRWDRQVYFDGGTYTFHARADNGIRVWIDGELVLNQWYTNAQQEHTFTQDLRGSHHIAVEFYEDTGLAVAEFWWD